MLHQGRRTAAAQEEDSRGAPRSRAHLQADHQIPGEMMMMQMASKSDNQIQFVFCCIVMQLRAARRVSLPSGEEGDKYLPCIYLYVAK